MSLHINYKLIESRYDTWFQIMNACRFIKQLAMKAVCAQVCFAHMVEHTKSLLLGQIEMFSFVVTALMTDNFVPSMEKCVYQWE